MEDDVPEKLKRERADTIMELQAGISFELNQQKIGQCFNVLFDKTEGDYLIGRTEFDSPEVDNEVLIPVSEGKLKVGEFYNVEIVKADFFDLIGKIV